MTRNKDDDPVRTMDVADACDCLQASRSGRHNETDVHLDRGNIVAVHFAWYTERSLKRNTQMLGERWKYMLVIRIETVLACSLTSKPDAAGSQA